MLDELQFDLLTLPLILFLFVVLNFLSGLIRACSDVFRYQRSSSPVCSPQYEEEDETFLLMLLQAVIKVSNEEQEEEEEEGDGSSS